MIFGIWATTNCAEDWYGPAHGPPYWGSEQAMIALVEERGKCSKCYRAHLDVQLEVRPFHSGPLIDSIRRGMGLTEVLRVE